MRKVGIAASGLTEFSKNDLSIDTLMLSAIKSLFDESQNLSQTDIDVVITSTNDNNKYLANIVSELSGISPKTAHTIESLCNSGTSGIVSAYSYVASGLADSVLVIGAEKSNNPGLVLEWDKSRGQYTHPIYWSSMFTNAHMRKYGTTLEDIAYVSAKNHRNAIHNPYAFFKKEFTIDEIMKSKPLTENLRLYDCSMPCDGAAAVLVSAENTIKKFTDSPVWISGIGQKSISAGFTKNEELTSMSSVIQSASSACQMAKKTISDIDVAELHDAFGICEIIELEDLGFAPKGKGSTYVKNLYDTDDKKINPRGGLIGSGHPLGATGIAQTIEIFQQLQGKANKRQVEGAKTGLVQNMSAAATSSTVLILES